MVVGAVAADHGGFGVGAHAAAAHYVSARHARAQDAHRQRRDRGGRFALRRVHSRVLVERIDAAGAGGELDLRHRLQRAARAVPDEVRDRVVEDRRAVPIEFDAPALALLVETVAQERDDRARISHAAHDVFVSGAEPGNVGRHQIGSSGGTSSL